LDSSSSSSGQEEPVDGSGCCQHSSTAEPQPFANEANNNDHNNDSLTVQVVCLVPLAACPIVRDRIAQLHASAAKALEDNEEENDPHHAFDNEAENGCSRAGVGESSGGYSGGYGGTGGRSHGHHQEAGEAEDSKQRSVLLGDALAVIYNVVVSVPCCPSNKTPDKPVSGCCSQLEAAAAAAERRPSADEAGVTTGGGARCVSAMSLAEFRRYHPQPLLDFLLLHSGIVTT
jgi:hypothetical protein